MGIYKLAEYGVRKYIRKNKFICKRVKFSLFTVKRYFKYIQ